MAKAKETCQVTLNLSPEGYKRLINCDAIQLKIKVADDCQDLIWVYTDKYLHYFDIY